MPPRAASKRSFSIGTSSASSPACGCRSRFSSRTISARSCSGSRPTTSADRVMSRPVIALLTDFGLRDHYTGTMKGVALGICRDITFVDITHDIPPHDVVTAGLELAAAYRYFPAGTIFLVVVDPGVGSARRAIAAEAGGYQFVAPDNGVLSVVFDGLPPERIVELTNDRYARPSQSRTFEGRDRFAP